MATKYQRLLEEARKAQGRRTRQQELEVLTNKALTELARDLSGLTLTLYGVNVLLVAKLEETGFETGEFHITHTAPSEDKLQNSKPLDEITTGDQKTYNYTIRTYLKDNMVFLYVIAWKPLNPALTIPARE